MANEDNNSRMTPVVERIDNKLNFFTKNTYLSLSIIGGIALFLRLYQFPYDLPLTLDATDFFWYANDVTILKHFPTSYSFPNNGWPLFLSIFFSIYHSNNFLDYMALQRIITILISVFTIIPVYYLCTKFFSKPYPIIGTALFVFEPRIIQNSILGTSEPSYILLGTIVLALFLSSDKKLVYASFCVSSFLALVRYEGTLLFVVISIMFLVRYRKERHVIPKYALATSMFVLLLLPIVVVRIQTTGQDGLTSHISAGGEYLLNVGINEDNRTLALLYYVIGGFENLMKYIGWILIPIFVFFVPIGSFLIYRNRNYNKTTLILTIIALLIPAFYAYSRGLQETRYLYILYPPFCILSLFTVKVVIEKFRNRNIVLILLICGILLSSILFLGFKTFDYKHEQEAFAIAQHVTNSTRGVNDLIPVAKYYSSAVLKNKEFPILRSNTIDSEPKILIPIGIKSMDEYIKFGRDNGLTHLVLDGNANESFLNDVFYNEEKYPYLTKVYDSWDYNYKYHVKIYKINYEVFASKINNSRD